MRVEDTRNKKDNDYMNIYSTFLEYQEINDGFNSMFLMNLSVAIMDG